MIKLVTGKLGAGKTLYCVLEIAEHLSLGRTVVTNIELLWDELVQVVVAIYGVYPLREQWVPVDLNRTPHFHAEIPWGVRGHCVEVYLDELHLFFNARDWAKTNETFKELVSFFTQSRKAHVNMTLLMQEGDTVEKQFRVMAEWEYYIVSSEHVALGPLGKLPVKAFIVCMRDAKTGVLQRRVWKGYDKRFFGTYVTDAFLDDNMRALAETRPRVQPYVLRRVGFWSRLWISMKVNATPFAWLHGFICRVGEICVFWYKVITNKK